MASVEEAGKFSKCECEEGDSETDLVVWNDAATNSVKEATTILANVNVRVQGRRSDELRGTAGAAAEGAAKED